MLIQPMNADDVQMKQPSPIDKPGGPVELINRELGLAWSSTELNCGRCVRWRDVIVHDDVTAKAVIDAYRGAGWVDHLSPSTAASRAFLFRPNQCRKA